MTRSAAAAGSCGRSGCASRSAIDGIAEGSARLRRTRRDHRRRATRRGCRRRSSCCRTAAASATACSCSTTAARDYLLATHRRDIADALTRGAAWVTLWDNVLEGRVSRPARSSTRPSARCRARATSRTRSACLSYVTPRVLALSCRRRSASRARRRSRRRCARASRARRTTSLKSAWFSAFRDDGADARRRRVARARVAPRREDPRPDVRRDRRDRDGDGAGRARGARVAARSCRRSSSGRRTRIARRASRSSCRRSRPIRRCASAAFERFRQLENRRREPWVLESLAYLNHPLREARRRAVHRARRSSCCARFSGPATSSFPTRWTGSDAVGTPLAARRPRSCTTSSRRSCSIRSGCGGPCSAPPTISSELQHDRPGDLLP